MFSGTAADLLVKRTFIQFELPKQAPVRRSQSEPRSGVSDPSQFPSVCDDLPHVCETLEVQLLDKVPWIVEEQTSTVATSPGSPRSSVSSDSDVLSVSSACDGPPCSVWPDASAYLLSYGFMPVPVLDHSALMSSIASPSSDMHACCNVKVESRQAAPAMKALVQTEAFNFDWVEDGKRLRSSRTRITRSKALPGGDFVFTVFPQRQSQKRGGASFQAAGGRGYIEVKCSTCHVPCRLVAVVSGTKTQKSLALDFCEDGVVQRVPQTWNFEAGVDAKTDQFTISFSFAPLPGH